MAVTVSSFTTNHPFFAKRDPNVISSAIAFAQGEFDATVCGADYDRFVEYQAAVVLLTNPKGAPTSKTAESGLLADYQARLKTLKASNRVGPMVIR